MTHLAIIEMKKHSLGVALVAISCFAALTAGCGGSGQPATVTGPQVFASQDAAGKAIYDAAKAGNSNALLVVFGPNAKELVLSGDQVEDRNGQAKFAASYDQMHRWDKLKDGGYVLTVGASNYPLPFPLVKNSVGQWYFDSDSGKREILSRRIGDNELATMSVVSAMADAQEEYFSQTHDGSNVHQYAQKFVSDDNKQNGLYWKVAEGQPESPLGPLAAKASADGYSGKTSSEPFHGYFYRILSKQTDQANGGARDYIVDGAMTGGYAILAYPAEYQNSGVMTFVISQDGAIYQKDLGPSTADAAKAITALDLDAGWKLVE